MSVIQPKVTKGFAIINFSYHSLGEALRDDFSAEPEVFQTRHGSLTGKQLSVLMDYYPYKTDEHRGPDGDIDSIVIKLTVPKHDWDRIIRQ